MLQAPCCALQHSWLAGRRSVPSTPTWVRAEPGADESGYVWAGPVGWHCVRPAARPRHIGLHACMLGCLYAGADAPMSDERGAMPAACVGCRRTPSPTASHPFSGTRACPGRPLVRPDADVIVPMYAPYAHADLVLPFVTTRNISSLLRFEFVPGDGKYLVANYSARGPPAHRGRCARATPLPPGAHGCRMARMPHCVQSATASKQARALQMDWTCTCASGGQAFAACGHVPRAAGRRTDAPAGSALHARRRRAGHRLRHELLAS